MEVASLSEHCAKPESHWVKMSSENLGSRRPQVSGTQMMNEVEIPVFQRLMEMQFPGGGGGTLHRANLR